ncbi:MAG: hypothetical protein EAX96_12350 [Candidatus Lokiarchaeota archaeon]|nr:hypothetical protein [Candidatus Lokiarchaeota archaeon]
MDQDEIFDDEDEEKRVEEERKKLKELGLEGASINAFENITSSDQKNLHKKREEEQKSKKFIGFGE